MIKLVIQLVDVAITTMTTVPHHIHHGHTDNHVRCRLPALTHTSHSACTVVIQLDNHRVATPTSHKNVLLQHLQ